MSSINRWAMRCMALLCTVQQISAASSTLSKYSARRWAFG